MTDNCDEVPATFGASDNDLLTRVLILVEFIHAACPDIVRTQLNGVVGRKQWRAKATAVAV
jgi:hypothetical protein